MANVQGDWIWYELMTTDPDGARAFYRALIGVEIGESDGGDVDYRMIAAPGGADGAGGLVGGVLKLDQAMVDGGARPIWMGYVGVDDVDATYQKAQALGGRPLVPPTDIPGVGRFAMFMDPQGAPLYIMRGASEETSTVYRGGDGRPGFVNWNELATSDWEAAWAFHSALFGWTLGEGMDMPMGRYQFIDQGGETFGAMCNNPAPGAHPMWNYYFNVPSIDAAGAAATANGGTVTMGPHEIPGGQYILMGTDPQGAAWALVGPK